MPVRVAPDQVPVIGDPARQGRVGGRPPALEEEGGPHASPGEEVDDGLLGPRTTARAAGVLGVEGQGDAHAADTTDSAQGVVVNRQTPPNPLNVPKAAPEGSLNRAVGSLSAEAPCSVVPDPR